MSQKIIEEFAKNQIKTNLPEIREGDYVKVYQKIKEKGKERNQIFEGLVIARKHGKGINSTITVRNILSGVGVEKIFPIHSPLISKIEVARKSKVRRSKLYYVRRATGKKAKLKHKEFAAFMAPEEESEKTTEETEVEKTEETK